MARRRQAPQTSHQPKGRKRPRTYHHGRSQGKVNESKIKRALPAFERAEADREEGLVRAREMKTAIADWQRCLDGLARVNPSVLAPLTVP